MTRYIPQYKDWLNKAEAATTELPIGLQQLIEKYEHVHNVLNGTDPETQQRLFFILVQTDAVICAHIYSIYKDKLPVLPDRQEKVDKVKLMALRAKALKLKWEK
jgi:hypothetical protein